MAEPMGATCCDEAAALVRVLAFGPLIASTLRPTATQGGSTSRRDLPSLGLSPGISHANDVQ